MSPDALHTGLRAWLSKMTLNEYDSLRGSVGMKGCGGEASYTELSRDTDGESNKQRSQFLHMWLDKAVGAKVEVAGTSGNQSSATYGCKIVSFEPLRDAIEKYKPQSLCSHKNGGKPKFKFAQFAFVDE